MLKTKSLLTSTSNALPLNLKEPFPTIIWIFTKSEGNGIKSRLPFKIFSTLQSNSKRRLKILLNFMAFSQYLNFKDTPKPLLAKWTYDFFSNNPDAVAKMDNGLNHNDFRRKYLMKLQAETVFRTSYAPLQHFYEILHKFAKKDDEAPQKAQR